jgi:hypothetical protein
VRDSEGHDSDSGAGYMRRRVLSIATGLVSGRSSDLVEVGLQQLHPGLGLTLAPHVTLLVLSKISCDIRATLGVYKANTCDLAPLSPDYNAQNAGCGTEPYIVA